MRQLSLGAVLLGSLAACAPSQDKGDANGASDRPERKDGLCITPEAAYTNHVLKAGGIVFAAQFSGLDSTRNPAGESLRWLVNGNEVSRAFELEPDNFRRGDVVELQRISGGNPGATPHILERDQTVILNSTPRVTAVVLERSRANGAYLECRVHANDADDDPLQMQYEWLLDGKRMAGAAGEMVALHDVPKGSRIEVDVVVSDGLNASQAFRSRSYTIDNLPPRLKVPSQATVASQQDGSRKVSFTIKTEDPDGDEVEVTMEGAPSDAVYDRASGQVSWSVSGPVAATVVKVRANDGKGATVEHELRIAAEETAGR